MCIRVTADIVIAFYIYEKPGNFPFKMEFFIELNTQAHFRLRPVLGAAHGGHLRSDYAVIMAF